jgi:type I restriction enzyme R subunit
MREKHEVVAEFFHGIDFQARHTLSAGERANQFAQALAKVITDEEEKRRYLEEYGRFARLFKLLRANQAAIEVADDEEFFRKIAGAIMKISPPIGQVSSEAEQAVKQFVSEGLSAGEVIDVFELAGETRPELSILSDEFLDKLVKGLSQPALGVEILKKILSDEIRVRSRTNRMQAKLFSDQLHAALERYQARQISSSEVIERLVELAKKVRDARRRHEALHLSVEEVAFYDALAGGSDDWRADPKLAEIAQALVRGIKEDLAVDWADHEATEAAIRVKIKRLLRRYKFKSPRGGGHGVDRVVDVLLDQARELYRFWPDVPLAELPI